MKERMQEIYNGLQERLKSPFLLTFILVWTIHNWELIYAIFTFDESLKFIQRLRFFEFYINVRGRYHLLYFPIIWSFASILIFILVNFITEGITLTYNKWIRPFLYLKIDTNKLKTEEDYKKLEKRRIALQELVYDLKTREEDASLKLGQKEKEFKAALSDFSTKEIESIKREEELKKFTSNQKEKIAELSDEIKLISDLNYQSKLNKESLEILKNENENLSLFKTWIEISNPSLLLNWNNIDKTALAENNNLINRFRNLFGKYEWINQFKFPDGTSGNETFTVSNSGSLTIQISNKPIFYISNIQFFDPNILTFTKTNFQTKKAVNVKIDISNNSDFIGTENGNISIMYSRILQ